MPLALIIGIASQDGSYLAELLLAKKYSLVGTFRPDSADDVSNIANLKGKYVSEVVDLLNPDSIIQTITKYQPREIYNLAALSVPVTSWSQAYLTGQVNALGPLAILEAVRHHSPHSRFFQASSREIFGSSVGNSADESTPVAPDNPYAIAKAYAHFMTKMYRNNGIFAVNGILFNHESPRRPPVFVTRKITLAAAGIKTRRKKSAVLGPDRKLHLWETDSARDRGFAKEYVEAMWLMLQNRTPKDYVISSGELHSVGEICEIAFSKVGLNWRDHTVIDGPPGSTRITPGLKGDSSAIRRDLGWQPKTTFKELIEMMVAADLSHLS